jgi:hypothetical protein
LSTPRIIISQLFTTRTNAASTLGVVAYQL